MKKISAFITTGVENVIPVLEAVKAAADAFPPLKSAVGGALWIHNVYTGFKSNQDDWKAFGEYVAQAVACVSVDVSRSGNPAQFDQALKELGSMLDEIISAIKEVPELQASRSWFRRFFAFLKDRGKIPALEAKFNRSLSNFNLGTSIDTRNELAKTFANTEGLIAGVSVLASNVKRMDENSTLRQLKVADGSSWNTQKMCQEGTRSDLLAGLEEFASARDPSSPERVLLLTGIAGCGKTAIAQSVAERLSKQSWPSPRLGACFNFNAQVEDRRTPKFLFSTIALSLSAAHPILEATIVDALSSDRTLSSATLVDQFHGLIRLPLSALPKIPPHPTVLILDALDEIPDNDNLEPLLKLLAKDFAQLPASCRVIATCRPNSTILHRLESADQHHIVRRQIELKDAASLRDISLVARTRLRQIATDRNLGDLWPARDSEEMFIRKAAGLFVWVDVACKAIESSARPAKELHRLLAGNETEEGMNELYIKILDGCLWKRKTFSFNYHLVLGTIVALKTPLSANAIHELIGSLLKADGDLEDVLEPLASVILGVSTLAPRSSPTRPLEISHESFREFVTTAAPEDKRKYAVNELESSQRLALQCLRVLNDELPQHVDMLLGLFPGTDEEWVIPSPKDSVVSEALGYTCDHWMGHLSVVTAPAPELLDALRQFLHTNLIPWMMLCASRGQFHEVHLLQAWLTQHRSYVQIDFTSEVDQENLAGFLEAVYSGLQHMRRLEEALAACQLWVAAERELMERDPMRLTDALARSLNNISIILSGLGQREEALVAIEEAVRIYRQLATDRPVAFNPDLAISLGNLSNRLSDLGRREEALVAIEEAVKIYRQLPTDRPAAFNPRIVDSLGNLSLRLSGLGRREDALVAIEDAVKVYRQLATDRPATFSPDLARALNNLSNRLSGLGRREEALVAIEEAVKVYRQLATDQPATSSSDLAMALNNFSLHLSDLGRREEALVAIEEALRVCRQLATDRPAAFSSNLAMALNNFSLRLSDLGRREEALVAIEEAVKVYRQLATDQPATFSSDLATALNNFSLRLSDLGRREDALVAIEDAVKVFRQLATDRPAMFSPDLARALNNLSLRLSDLGRREDALVAIEDAVKVYRQLATDRPATFSPDLARALNNLSNCLSDLGRREEALVAIEEAVRIRRQLATDRPAVFNPDLADSLNSLASRFRGLGISVGEALAAIRESVAIYRQEAAEQPAVFNRDLANSLDTLASCLSDAGQHKEAVKSIQEAVALQRQLVEQQPEAFTPNLAEFLRTMAGCISKQGDVEGALGPIAEGVTLYRQLALQSPARFKPYLVDVLGRQADYLAATGKEADAEVARAERANLI